MFPIQFESDIQLSTKIFFSKFDNNILFKNIILKSQISEFQIVLLKLIFKINILITYC